MAVDVIVGAQWGDEGKGKIVDLITEGADLVARYAGGANAGHTLVVGGQKTVIRLVPSAVLHAKPRCLLGAAMVIDPRVLRDELESLAARGVDVRPGRVLVSDRAHVVLDRHIAIDRSREEGAAAIGTTKRGIGPAYEDKVARYGVRVADFIDTRRFRARLEQVAPLWDADAKAAGITSPTIDATVETYTALGAWLAPYVCDATDVVHAALDRGERVVAEGAQGTLLDIDHGTYPYVTSSTVTAAGVCLGLGVGPTAIGSVLGITKAYATRVGAGPFPSELLDATGDHLRTQGNEFGSVTGRPRRCGWLDLVALKHAVRLNGITALALTKIDVLRGLPRFEVVTEYRRHGELVRGFPETLDGITVGTTTFEGFDVELGGARRFDELPTSVRALIELIESSTKVPVTQLSVGPDRVASLAR